MPRHILIKLTKTKHTERIWKAAREKQRVIYKGNPIYLTADHSAEILQTTRKWQDIFKVLKGKTYNQDYCTQKRYHSKLMEKSKAFQQSKVKRIQYHQTNFTTNVKGTYIVKKYKRRSKIYKINPKQLRKCQ